MQGQILPPKMSYKADQTDLPPISFEELKQASRIGDEEGLLKLLKSTKPEYYPFDHCNFALIAAAGRGQLQVVKLLLQNEQIRRHAAFERNLALREAAKGNHQDVVVELLKVRCVKKFFLSIEGFDEEALNRSRVYYNLKNALATKNSQNKMYYKETARAILFSGTVSNAEPSLLALALKAKEPRMASVIATFPSVRAKVDRRDLKTLKKALKEGTSDKLSDMVVEQPSQGLSVKLGPGNPHFKHYRFR